MSPARKDGGDPMLGSGARRQTHQPGVGPERVAALKAAYDDETLGEHLRAAFAWIATTTAEAIGRSAERHARQRRP